MSTQWHVYTGFWLNESKGPTLGWTLTTTTNTGLILVAAIGIFVSMLSGQVWGIICFVLHQVRCTRDPQDGLYHQQQALLANSGGPSSSIFSLAKMGSAWKGRAAHSRRRIVPLIIIAGAELAAFTLAGIYSSQINSQADEVLIRSPACGYLTGTTNPVISNYTERDWKLATSMFIEQSTTAKWAKAYERACYGAQKDPSVDCNFFAVPAIESTAQTAPCPFAEKICLAGAQGGFETDTGLVSTSKLGMNAKAENSLYYRRKMTCAPLVTNGYANWSQTTEPTTYPGLWFYQYYYGPRISGPTTYYSTAEYNTYQGNGSSSPYPAMYVSALAGDSYNAYYPINELNLTNADVGVIFVITNVEYTQPVTDIWFNATTLRNNELGLNESMYSNEEPMIVMGCAEQHQLCDSRGDAGNCSPLTGYWLVSEWAMANLVGAEAGVAYNLLLATSLNSVVNMFSDLGSDALAASELLFDIGSAMSAPLPDNQWQIEIPTWQNYVMARLQRLLVNVATGPWLASSDQYVVAPNATYTARWDICKQMKIRDSRYYSFSGLGLAVMLFAGLGIVALNLSLSTIVAFFQCRVFKSRRGMEKREDWMLDGLFQLQRMAFEGERLGTWSRRPDHDIPVTLKGEGLKNEKFVKPRRTVSSYQEVAMEPPPSMGFENRRQSSAHLSVGGDSVTTAYASTYYSNLDDVSLMENKWPAAHQREFI